MIAAVDTQTAKDLNMSTDYDQSDVDLFRENVKRFIAEEITPHYEDWEKAGKIPRELWNKIGEAGFLCVDIPEQYGGFGAHFIFSATIIEELARAGCAALASNVSVHSDICAPYILHAGTEEQKQKYLAKMISGECIGAIAMTEPGAGSDLQGVRTNAKPDGADYIINGSKTFITNGQHCDIVLTVTRTNMEVSGSKGTSLFIVETTTEGFSRGRNLDKIGQHAADTSELFFEDVRVPASAILGGLDRGFLLLMTELPRERLILAISAIAACEGMLDWTIEYTLERKAFNQTISDFQNTRFKMAEMKTDTRANRAFTNECINLFCEGKLDAATVSMLKLSTTELQGRVADGCLQLFGGYGYMTEYPIARAFVDARIQRIYGGTSEIMKEIIGKAIYKR
jgi:alkylation response protein AidB-like acyl-CoA dehydrogenase